MKIKFFEVRDEGTCIAVMAIQMLTGGPQGGDYWNRVAARFLEREGYPGDGSAVIYLRLGDQRASVDPYDWRDRTNANAHNYISQNFSTLDNGAVVDVRVILGETFLPASPEILVVS